MKKTQNNRAINWVGFLNSPEKVGEFYAKSDVTVLPTRWDEAFSYIPLESLSSGTAVIASRCGGNMEAIQENETGILFTPEKGMNSLIFSEKLKSPSYGIWAPEEESIF